MNHFTPFLLPFGLLYGTVTAFRNLLFDIKVLPSKRFSVPVISVGNLTTGGTGKTPHVEYLIRLLKDNYQIATVSRGYKRKTSGFVIGDSNSDYRQLGDEPAQFIKKFPDITVSVDESRVRGIKSIIALKPQTNVFLLDDAYQHRYVSAGLKILLTDYRNLYTRNYPLPAGNLREFRCGSNRADIIIVTKTDKVLPSMLRQHLIEEIKPKSHQKLYFSYITYGKPTPLTEAAKNATIDKFTNILLIAGIANPYPLEEHIKKTTDKLETILFPDHYQYKTNDLLAIQNRFHDIFSKKKVIITTEKDAMRLSDPVLKEYIDKLPVFYIPIEIAFHHEDKENFDNDILNYISRTLK